MASDLQSLLKSGTLLTQRQTRFLELLEESRLRIVDAELLSGLPSGAVAAAAQKAREDAAAGRKPEPFGGTLLLIEARSRARERTVEENLLDQALQNPAAAVAVLKERKRDRRAGVQDELMSGSTCSAVCAENAKFRQAFVEGFRRVQERAERLSAERLSARLRSKEGRS